MPDLYQEDLPPLEAFITSLFSQLNLASQDESQIEYTARLVEEEVRFLVFTSSPLLPLSAMCSSYTLPVDTEPSDLLTDDALHLDRPLKTRISWKLSKVSSKVKASRFVHVYFRPSRSHPFPFSSSSSVSSLAYISFPLHAEIDASRNLNSTLQLLQSSPNTTGSSACLLLNPRPLRSPPRSKPSRRHST